MGIYTSAQIIYGFPYDVEDLGLEDDQYDENYNLLHHHGYDTYPEMIGVCVEDREMGRPGNPLSLDAFTCSPSDDKAIQKFCTDFGIDPIPPLGFYLIATQS